MKNRVLVTGGAGFIGSNLLLYLHQKYPDSQFLNIDKLGYASDLQYLEDIEDSSRYDFQKIDIVDRDAVRKVIRSFQPQAVFHLAAESHVDNSIEGPEPFMKSNFLGTFNLLEECRQLWQEEEEAWANNRFLHVSTDEVYGELGDEGAFSEDTAYAPNSPYSASKAGSDFIVRSYHHTYDMNVVTTNCSNNFGPHQHDEKLIPTVIRTALNHPYWPDLETYPGDGTSPLWFRSADSPDPARSSSEGLKELVTGGQPTGMQRGSRGRRPPDSQN